MRYLTCAETAKALRQQLKVRFPGVKFTVRSHTYSGGASINVGYTDGPAYKTVKNVAEDYSGSDFDGMIDLKVSNTSWLMPDGSIHFARTPGTTGSKGIIAATKLAAVPAGAEEVNLMADFVFVNRDYSAATLRRASAIIAKRFGCQVPPIAGSEDDGYLDGEGDREVGGGYVSARALIWRELEEMTA